MRTPNYFLVILAATVLLQGCSTLYFGHSKEEWNSFSDDEKTAIKAEYQTIINSRNEQTHTDKINARTQSIIDYGVAAP